MAQLLQTLSIISFAVAGVCLVLAALFWFFFRIPTVIGDLSGRTARKSIAKMRAANEKAGIKSYKESKTNVERGKITGTMPNSDELSKTNSATVSGQPETGLLSDNKAAVIESEATGMLDEETGRLDEATGILESEATGLLVNENAAQPIMPNQNQAARMPLKKIEMLEEVMLIHTNEVI